MGDDGSRPTALHRIRPAANRVPLPLAAPAVAASLVAFILVYFGAFGAGTYYLLRMMAKPPAAGEPEPSKVPQRAAGITPASGVVASTGREA
jgi:cytochrome d ubiquinol oxidase subunit I